MTQFDLFNPTQSAEFLAWLQSPPGTPAPVAVTGAKQRKEKRA